MSHGNKRLLTYLLTYSQKDAAGKPVRRGLERLKKKAAGLTTSFNSEYRTPRWRRGVVAIVVRRMNEVTLPRARLVLGWVTVFGRVYRHGL